jgi:hypothetical protein
MPNQLLRRKNEHYRRGQKTLTPVFLYLPSLLSLCLMYVKEIGGGIGDRPHEKTSRHHPGDGLDHDQRRPTCIL